LDATVRTDIVAKLSEALRDRYVFPDLGERAATRITRALQGGEYDRFADRNAFVQRLSADIQAIVRDKHLTISSLDGGPPWRAGPREMAPSEAGLVRADKLAGDIGYIEVVAFPPPDVFRAVLDRAMLGLQGSRGLIIDIRRNGGGSPASVAFLVSYLVQPGRAINTILSRTPKTNEYTSEIYRSVATPVSFAAIPIFVLTSKDTFSGGEEFAYDIQALKRGMIIGEVTGGGANPTGPVDLGNGIIASIPWGRAENPVTKTNWEGQGVQPDMAVSAQDAFKTALVRLGQKPAADVASASLGQVFAPRSAPRPGAEAIAREFIARLASGKPDYASMTAEFATFSRERLTMTRGIFSSLGKLRSTTFARVGPMGGDEYRAVFDRGEMIVDVMINSEGKIVGAMMMPASQKR
jgi:hypothetical protein